MTFLLYIINISLLLVLTVKMSWFKRTGLSGRLLILVLAVKMAVSVAGGFLYMKLYNGGDTSVFFQDGLVLNEILIDSPQYLPEIMQGTNPTGEPVDLISKFKGWTVDGPAYNDNRTVSLLHALIAIFSGGIYNIHAIWFAFLSLTGLSGWLMLLNLKSEKLPLVLISSYFLAPDALFFLSIASKESASIFITGIIAGNLSSVIRSGPGFRNISVICIFLASGFFIKPYFTLLLIPAMTAWFLCEKHLIPNPWIAYLSVYSGYAILLLAASQLSSAVDIPSILYAKRQAFDGFAKAYPDSFDTWIHIPAFSDTWVSVFKAIPGAIGVGFIQPMMIRTDNLFISLLSLENIAYIIITLLMIFRIIKHPAESNRNSILLCLFLLLSMYALIGLTTPVAGAIVRYKSVVLPMLIFCSMYMLTFKKVKTPTL